jgi:hypothetical protein
VLQAVKCENEPALGSGGCGSKDLGIVQTARALAEECWGWIQDELA